MPAATPTLYEILESQEDATSDEIKKRFRILAKRCHPDSAPGLEDKFREIAHAYKILSDPVSRADYDLTLRMRRNSTDSLEDFFRHSAQMEGGQLEKLVRELAAHVNVTKIKIYYKDRKILSLSLGAAAALQAVGFIVNPLGSIIANIGLNRLFTVEVRNEVVDDYEQAAVLHEAGALSEAERLYKKSLEISEYFVPSILNLGLLYRQRGENGKAVERFRKLLEIAPVGELARIARQHLEEIQRY